MISMDMRLRDGKLHDVDREIFEQLRAGEGLIELKETKIGKQLLAGDQVVEVKEQTLSENQCLFVRFWRVVEQGTWRYVAAQAHKKWGDWSPPSNQIVGMELCEAAAKHFGEDYMQPPWN